MRGSPLASRNGTVPSPNPEVSDQAHRRTLTAAYKLRILREADRCAYGEQGALLRREGLYSSQLALWRKQHAEGRLTAVAAQRGRPTTITAESAALATLRAEHERVLQKLAAAELIIDIQKKVSALLGLTTSHDPTSGPS